jgi:hypothetical protein
VASIANVIAPPADRPVTFRVKNLDAKAERILMDFNKAA